jgi:uncharacterized protein (DUF1810 family)
MTHAITRTPARPLSRFVDAQRAKYPQILRELRQGRKRTHWMWYVFPQLTALGKSETARYYGIADRAEALAYLDNPTLRTRLYECTMAVLSHPKLILHSPDDRKLRSSMTLFSQVVADPTLPNAVLEKFFNGLPDQLTLDVLAGKPIPEQTSMGRVEVRRPLFSRTAAAGRRVARTDTMTRAEVTAFMRGFGMAPGLVSLIADEWMSDQDKAYDKGLSEGRDEAISDNWDDRYPYMG